MRRLGWPTAASPGSPIFFTFRVIRKKKGTYDVLTYLSRMPESREKELINELKRQTGIISEPPILDEVEEWIKSTQEKLFQNFDGKNVGCIHQLDTMHHALAGDRLFRDAWQQSEAPITELNGMIEKADKCLGDLHDLGILQQVESVQGTAGRYRGLES